MGVNGTSPGIVSLSEEPPNNSVFNLSHWYLSLSCTVQWTCARSCSRIALLPLLPPMSLVAITVIMHCLLLRHFSTVTSYVPRRMRRATAPSTKDIDISNRGIWIDRLLLAADLEYHRCETIDIVFRPSSCLSVVTSHRLTYCMSGTAWLMYQIRRAAQESSA